MVWLRMQGEAIFGRELAESRIVDVCGGGFRGGGVEFWATSGHDTFLIPQTLK